MRLYALQDDEVVLGGTFRRLQHQVESMGIEDGKVTFHAVKL